MSNSRSTSQDRVSSVPDSNEADLFDGLSDRLAEEEERARTMIRRHPVVSLAVAGFFGFLVARIVRSHE